MKTIRTAPSRKTGRKPAAGASVAGSTSPSEKPPEAQELNRRLLEAQAAVEELTRRHTLAQQRLEAAAWKATLAAVTTGLAHDFNNKLAGTLSLSDLLLAQIPADDAKRPSLELIKSSALEMAQMVKRLVSLHRGQPGRRQYADLNQLVSDLSILSRRILPRRIALTIETAPAQVPVYLDGVLFERALLHLVLNAADAMADRGELILRVTVHETPQELNNGRGMFPRLPCACLSVQDTGSGIPPEQLPRLFTPLFSTKAPSQGTGLGLTVARGFVEQHGGAISVESREGAGTTFRLWVPQADFTEADQAPKREVS